MRLALLALFALFGACSSQGDHTGDPAVGRWRGETGKMVELRADGTLDMEPILDTRCTPDDALTARCKARQRWHRSGSIVTLERAAIARPDSIGLSGDKPCDCRIERIDVQLRGDELISGHEHAQRVK